MKQKNAIIFGDSYSTFYGLVPEGFAYYYGGDRRENDVSKVDEALALVDSVVAEQIG